MAERGGANYRASPHLGKSPLFEGKGSDLRLLSYFQESGKVARRLNPPAFKVVPRYITEAISLRSQDSGCTCCRGGK